MKTAYFDMFSGVSGDMILGALVDNGYPVENLEAVVEALGLDEVKIEVHREKSHGIQATRLKVLAQESHHHRGLKDINGLIDASSLPDRVKVMSRRVFLRLGEAEATVHGVDLERIHFHEVGALDSIVDIVGVAAGIDFLGIERFYAGPFRFGTGFVEFSHGRLALPVPAVARLTLGCPTERTTVEAELTTPTGAAIVTTLVAPGDYSPDHPLAFDKVGYGMGSRTLPDRPNMLRLFMGKEAGPESLLSGDVLVLECNLDDMNPEYYDYLMEKLFAAGALDVFLTPVQMKKNRPGVCLRVLARENDLTAMSGIVFLNSSTIGLRWQKMRRMVLERRSEKASTPWGELTVKKVILPNGESRIKPEYDELRAIAQKTGIPLIDLSARLDALLNR